MLSAYFHVAACYKCMRLTTSFYGIPAIWYMTQIYSKHTSGSQKEAVSDLLSNAQQTVQPSTQDPRSTTTQSLVHFNAATNNHSQVNIRIAQSILPPTFNFHSCTVNINYGISNQQ